MQTALVKSALIGSLAHMAFAANAPTNLDHGHSEEWLAQLEEEFAQRNDHLYVHLIPHSHDDVGWLKTPDEYFTGSKQDIQTANVQNIIDTYITELIADPEKRFTQVEIKFFSMWWDHQTDQRKDQTRQLVKEGRLEFVNAGWSMHDEACTHHDDMMNNMLIGHEWLQREFGDYARPVIGWHIDPFGHSNANPRLFAEMGFDAWFFARIDYEDKEVRMKDKSMQWVWKPFNASLGDNTSIFTHTMPDHYHGPESTRYDENNFNLDPIVIDENLSTFNADIKAKQLRKYLIDSSSHFATNRLMIPWGDDFWYSNADLTFRNLEGYIRYFNEQYTDITLLYSTPSEYINALKEQKIKWPVRYDDMFPYADQKDDYWTGYFTSRADAKKQDRQTQANFHASSKVYAQKLLEKGVDKDTVKTIRENKHAMLNALGIMQHHDAITGTAKQAVADRYSQILEDAVTQNNELYASLVGDKATAAGLDSSLKWSACTVTSTTPIDCGITSDAGQAWMVTAQNPSTVDSNLFYFKAPADGAYKTSVLQDGAWFEVPSDLICFQATKDTKKAETVEACDLYIQTNIKAQSFAYLKVETVDADALGATVKTPKTEDTTIENDKLRIEFKKPGSLVITQEAQFSISDLVNDIKSDMKFALQYYNPATGDDDYKDSDNVASGAYIFKPKEGDMDKKMYSTYSSQETYKGANTGIHAFNLYFENAERTYIYTAMIRLLPGADTVEWEVQMHGIPVTKDDDLGKEVVVTWSMVGEDFDSEKTFYTDSNGLEMQTRVLNERPDWTLVTDEFASSNYYPINSALAIRSPSSNMQLTIMNDRSQAGSVLSNGVIEIMQNRRLLHDDGRGVGEPLDEKNADGEGIQVNTRYFVQLFDYTKTASKQRQVQLLIDEPISFFVAQADSDTVTEGMSITEVDIAKFDGDLKIHLFPQDTNMILVRLENLADLFDGTPAETPMFDLEKYCLDLYAAQNPKSPKTTVHIRERTLTNNQDYEEMAKKKFAWPTTDGPSKTAYPADKKVDSIVALQPQRIRLYAVHYDAIPEAELFLE